MSCAFVQLLKGRNGIENQLDHQKSHSGQQHRADKFSADFNGHPGADVVAENRAGRRRNPQQKQDVSMVDIGDKTADVRSEVYKLGVAAGAD